MEADDILAKFDAVQEEQEHYLARCPAHPDSRPSLVIWFKSDGKCTMTCRAGCRTRDVIAAAGLRWPDLKGVTGPAVTAPAQRSALVSGPPVARLAMYVHRTSGAFSESPAASYAERRFGVGAGLAAELRLGYDGGTGFDHTSAGFRRFPRLTVPLCDFRGVALGLQGRDLSGDCPGRWLSLTNPDGMRWLPYGVFRPGAEVVLVTEGPGDGLTAVAADPRFGAVVIRGASLARNAELTAEIAGHLRGRHVVVAGDNDKAGREFTKTVAAAFRAHALAPAALTLPRRAGDISEWREKGRHFAEAFPAAVLGAEPMQARPNKARDKRLAAYAAATRGEV